MYVGVSVCIWMRLRVFGRAVLGIATGGAGGPPAAPGAVSQDLGGKGGSAPLEAASAARSAIEAEKGRGGPPAPPRRDPHPTVATGPGAGLFNVFLKLYFPTVLHMYIHISRGHSLCAYSAGFGIFPGVLEFFVRCAKMSVPWGRGVCVYFLKSVRKVHFRNVWVKGGGCR